MIFRSWRKRAGRSGARGAGRETPGGATEASLESQLEQITALGRANRQDRDPEVERRLLRLRHRAGIGLVTQPSGDPDFASPFAELTRGASGLPEAHPAELTAGTVRTAILEGGCLLVRGLLDPAEAARLAEEIDGAFSAFGAEASADGPSDGYYEEFVPDPRFKLENRAWVTGGGGIWAADSPRVMFQVLDAFERVGLRRLATDYLGERPVISVNKCTLRRVTPDTGTGWHQDGAFLGDRVRALNIWLSLSHCGDVAPGLDLVPRRLDHIVPTGTEGALFGWSVSQKVAERSAGDAGIVRPIFDPGDVLLFDELCLHSTATDAAMRDTRYAIESWCFGPSAFPPDYVPLAF
jgi:hypothetical protein